MLCMYLHIFVQNFDTYVLLVTTVSNSALAGQYYNFYNYLLTSFKELHVCSNMSIKF